MDRRVFMAGLALGVLAAPRAASAQRARKIARIGILLFDRSVSEMTGPETRSRGVNALLRGLRELGYVYGQDFVTEPRGGESNSELWPKQASELVQLRVDVIVSAGLMVRACKQATSTIPIVMAGNGDPVGEGLIQSLAHPGGNITGLADQSVDLVGKRLGMLKELAPSAKSVAIISTPERSQLIQETIEAPARKLGLKVLWLDIRDAGELDGAFRAGLHPRGCDADHLT